MISANNYKDLTEDEMWQLFDKIDLDISDESKIDENSDDIEEQEYLCVNCKSDSLVNDPSKGYFVSSKDSRHSGCLIWLTILKFHYLNRSFLLYAPIRELGPRPISVKPCLLRIRSVCVTRYKSRLRHV